MKVLNITKVAILSLGAVLGSSGLSYAQGATVTMDITATVENQEPSVKLSIVDGQYQTVPSLNFSMSANSFYGFTDEVDTDLSSIPSKYIGSAAFTNRWYALVEMTNAVTKDRNFSFDMKMSRKNNDPALERNETEWYLYFYTTRIGNNFIYPEQNNNLDGYPQVLERKLLLATNQSEVNSFGDVGKSNVEWTKIAFPFGVAVQAGNIITATNEAITLTLSMRSPF